MAPPACHRRCARGSLVRGTVTVGAGRKPACRNTRPRPQASVAAPPSLFFLQPSARRSLPRYDACKLVEGRRRRGGGRAETGRKKACPAVPSRRQSSFGPVTGALPAPPPRPRVFASSRPALATRGPVHRWNRSAAERTARTEAAQARAGRDLGLPARRTQEALPIACSAAAWATPNRRGPASPPRISRAAGPPRTAATPYDTQSRQGPPFPARSTEHRAPPPARQGRGRGPKDVSARPGAVRQSGWLVVSAAPAGRGGKRDSSQFQLSRPPVRGFSHP